MDFNKYEHYNRWYGSLRAEFYVNGHGNEEMSTTKRQCLEMKVLMWLWIFLVCLCASAKLEKSECPRKCDVPLGVESGRISDHQLTAFSHYENDYRFGAHRARLRLNSWPPGYRADKTILGDTEQFPWIRIDLGGEQIVTGIATQGYGNASVSEWITRYKLMYATKNEILEFVDNDGEEMIFKGNNDSNGIVKHDLAVPRITSSILLIPRNWTDNIGLRMEIYGCEPTYYFKAWLMFHNISFVYNYLNTSSDEYIQEAFKATGEIQRYFENVGGYLYNRVLRLSPQPSPQITTSAIAEVAIYCIETSVHRVRAKLGAFVHESSIFHPDYLKIRQPITCNCNPPVVDLHLKHRILESDIIWSSDKDFVLKPKVSINCSSPIQTKYRWTFFKIDRETSYFSPFMPFGLKDQPMVMLRPRLFGPGEFYVSVDVSFTNNITDTSADDFGFFRVQMPVLTAKIVAPSSIKRDAGNITIDGSGSHDAEYPQDHSKGLTFFWQCRRLCQEAPITPCFDADSNFFSERFTIDASSLKPKCTYEFNLTVTREPRISRASHRLYIEPAIQFSVVCVINCGRKVSVKRLFSLRVVCGKEECTSLATFSWMIFSEDDQGTLTRLGIKIPSDSIETFANMTQLNILKLENLSEVKDGQKFQVRVTANPYKSHFEEQAHHTFIVNAPPTNSEVQRKDKGCQVKPKEGFAIVTDFYITCLGWYDKDVPLRYAFMYTFDSSTILIQEGNVGNVTSKLPVGDPNKGYERLVDLKIFDAYGDFTSLPKKIKVRPPPASEKLLDVINNAQNNMRKLVAGNNVQKAADMAITILSVIDYNEKLKKDETFKDSVLNIMSGVKVDKINLVTKIAVITAYSTKRVDQSLPQNSQEDALTLIRKTTTFLQNVNTSAIKDLKVIGEIGENILTGIGNVLTSSSKDVDIDSPNKDPNFDVKKGRKITSECVELVNTITAEEEFCANPTIISTPYINLTACIEKATEMKVSKLLKGESGVKLPDAKDLFPPDLLDENTVVDVKLVSFQKNPYTWHPKSRSIKSSVLDVTLKNVTSGKALHVEGLSKPVEMFIKNWHRERDEIKPKETFFVKPSPPKSIKNMRFHKIVLPYGDADANIRIVPSRNEELEIYIRYKMRPTPAENNFQTVVPNFSSCLSYSEENGFSDCLSDPYLFTISPSITGHMGTHFIGIRYTPQLPEMNNTQSRTRVKRSCRGANGRQKRSCVEVKPPPLPENILKLQFQNNSDVQYDLFITMGLCMYWSPKDDEWTNRGCKVGPKATPGKLQCLCTHLSAFGGDLFVAPNPIDFDKVMSELGNLAASGNFVVLAFVCVIFGLYATGLIIARRADKIDKFEIAPNIHVIIGQDCAFTYDISIQTGIWRDCGTTANVAIILFGENGCTPPILLTQRQLGKRFFARGSVNTFTIHLQESLGSLYKIKIWHDNSGENPAWFFHQVLVTCNSTNEKWYFFGNQWLAVEKGDGKIEVDIISAGESESLSFSNLFYFRGAKTLSEKHLWLSLFTKAPHSTFTRCQRLSCCLSILFATMVANAMFYQQSTSNVDAFRVGPINLSWSQIKIGVQSGLVSIPVNVLVVAIFRNIRPSGLIDSGNSQDGEEEEEQANGCFPHFCVYIGWALCLMASLVSAAFVVFYSLMWGKTVANQWLTSVMISFFQDVIVIQPVKVVIIVSLLSLIVKKPIKNDEIRGQGHSDQSIDNSLTSSPPGNEELNKMRSVRILKRRLAKTLIEIGTCVSFLLLLVIVCYGNRDSNRFRFTTAVKHVFPNFEKVHNITSFWTWTRKNLLSGLFDVKWYNGMAFSYKEGFIRNREAFMIGMPRLRQKRIKEDPTCKAFHNEAELVRHFSRCIPHYSTETEDKTKYHLRGWIPVDDFEVFQHQFEKFYLCPRPWRYETAEQLETLSFQGLRSTYSGGGYIADLGYNTDDALQVIDNLEMNDWIDDMTAAVFVEFNIYQPTTSLFSAVKFLFEIFPNGGTNTIIRVKTLTIYSPKDRFFRVIYETSQLLFMILLLFCVGAEIGKVYQQGCKYFKSPWSWLEIILLLSSVGSQAMFFLKESYTSKFVTKVQENPFQSWSMDNISLWSDLEVTLLAFVVFLITMKLLRIIRFNPHIIQMRMTLISASKHFTSFTLVFLTMIISYVTLTTLTFGSNVYEYRSFTKSFSTILLMLIGAKAPFHELRRINIIIGPFFVFAYMVTIVMIFLNMFLAILNDAYTESRKLGHEGSGDLELFKLMKLKAKKFSKKTRVAVIKVLEAIPQLLWQRRSETAVTFEKEAFVSSSWEERNEIFGFHEDNNPSLTDIIALLSEIKHDISDSILSIDDIVPRVTIDRDSESTRSCRPDSSSDSFDFHSCSSNSLFTSESESEIAKLENLIDLGDEDDFFHSDSFIMDKWYHRNAEVGETFV